MKKDTSLIPFRMDEPSVSRRYKNDKVNIELEIDLNYKEYFAIVKSKNQFIRGIVCLRTLNNEKIKLLKNDMIYSIDDNCELHERERTDDELVDNNIWGRFQYTKSLKGIDRYFFNHNIALYKKHRNKLHKIVSDLIYAELERMKYQTN